MSSIIEDLFFGRINPTIIPNNTSQNALRSSELEQELKELLNEKERELFVEFIETEVNALAEDSLEYFISGFKLGAKIVLEVLKGEKNDR